MLSAFIVRAQRPQHHDELGDVAGSHTSTAHEHADVNHTAFHRSSSRAGRRGTFPRDITHPAQGGIARASTKTAAQPRSTL
jgi:hypothetical protein